ncbi:SARP family transcriptional regulator [Virgisporangium aliadipatigenens]|uniref:SARP family transcriptional regulator n=1 Tax=Virgisporangium aliadipatigenens TaxID=741659 RepID=A0A8J4DRV3_9ACTN|nr:AfsR/SARP family transcriptional regulator [Virgisporangium aliadipatigenens]GIJ46677.1 SARP family transcriptional regulator [Virgisporangium aliadipatigenens]
MRFGLLGSVEAWAEERPLPLGPPKRRCVLALLLLELGRVVTVDRIVDVLWPGDPPAGARATVFAHVSRLRQALAGTDPAVTLATVGAGYVLRAAPERVDLHRFRDLCAQAREIDDDHKRIDLLTEAIELWRGPAMSGALPEDARARLCRGLDESWLAARQDRIDARLRLGQPAAVLDEAAELVRAHPLQERATGQLMRALHRAGRTADALHAYDAFRRVYADELGLDPGSELRDLHRAILRDGTDAPRPAARRVPAELPRDLVGFTGRADELARLDRLLDEDTGALVAVSGTAGVGKTTFAVHWAHRVAGRFPDGQLFLNLRGFDPGGGALGAGEAVRRLLTALGVPAASLPADIDAQAGLYRSTLAGRRVLVVLDNVHDAGQVRPLLPGASGCTVLVTSRNALPGLVAVDGAHPVALELFTAAESSELLRKRLGAERVAAEPDAAAELVERCARLPLAMAVASARAAVRPRLSLAAIAAELGGGLDSFANNDTAIDIRTVLACSYRALSPPAARVFRLLGLHRGADISTPAAASVAGDTVAATRTHLAELVEANLLAERDGRHAFHDLLRAYALEQAFRRDSEAERDAAVARLLDHYTHSAYAADRLIYPARDAITLERPADGVTAETFDGHAAALAWFTAEHAVLIAAVRQASTSGLHARTWRLAWTLTDYLNLRGHWHDQRAVQRMALSAAERLDDRPALADAHRNLGRVHDMLGLDEEAQTHLLRAVEEFRALGDRVGQAYAKINLARTRERQRRFDDALRHDEEALELFRAAGHRVGQARALNNVAWGLAQRRDHGAAFVTCRLAIALNRSLGNRHGEATAWDSLGFTYRQAGRPARAPACYRRAVEMYRAAADRPNEARSLVELGDTLRETGSDDPARDAWRSALEILDDLDHPMAAEVRDRLTRAA